MPKKTPKNMEKTHFLTKYQILATFSYVLLKYMQINTSGVYKLYKIYAFIVNFPGN